MKSAKFCNFYPSPRSQCTNHGTYQLGCGFPVNSADFRLCLCKFCGKADRGRLAGQRWEFKTRRKSTAQLISTCVTFWASSVNVPLHSFQQSPKVHCDTTSQNMAWPSSPLCFALCTYSTLSRIRLFVHKILKPRKWIDNGPADTE